MGRNVKLSEKTKREIERQAIQDAETGDFTEYKGDTFTDIVFSPIDALAGTPSTKDTANAKQKYYNKVRARAGR